MTAHTGGADETGVRSALCWFLVGLPLALAYLVVVFKLHRGKAVAARDGEGYEPDSRARDVSARGAAAAQSSAITRKAWPPRRA
jgi:hypothetical protein